MEPYVARAFASLTTGIYVLTVIEDGRAHGMSSSWVTQVSREPPLFSAAVDCKHFSHAVIARTGVLRLKIVGRRRRDLEDFCYSSGGGAADNLTSFDVEPSPILGVPWLRLAMVSIEARVVDRVAAGDHTIFILSPQGVQIRAQDD